MKVKKTKKVKKTTLQSKKINGDKVMIDKIKKYFKDKIEKHVKDEINNNHYLQSQELIMLANEVQNLRNDVCTMKPFLLQDAIKNGIVRDVIKETLIIFDKRYLSAIDHLIQRIELLEGASHGSGEKASRST